MLWGNPRKCSAVCARKTLATFVVMHWQTKDVDCTRTFGHVNPRLTTQACYAESAAQTADSRAILTRQPVRAMPGSVRQAHNRNLRPDIAAARRVAEAASAAAQAVVAGSNLGAAKQRIMRTEGLKAYKKAFRGEMQRQYDAQQRRPRAGNTRQQLRSSFFEPLPCRGMSQAEFVAWQVKVAWGLIPAP